MIDKQQVIEMYKSGIGLKKIADDYDCTIDKIRWLLQKEGIWKPAKVRRYNDLPEEQIINLYKQDSTPEQIARKLNLTVGPVIRVLDKSGVRKPVWLKVLPYNIARQVLDKDYFASVVKEYITQKNIMEYLGCGQDMIISLCKYHGIELQSSAMGRSLLKRKQRDDLLEINVDNFIELYEKQHLSLEDVRHYFGISMTLLNKLIKKWGVKIRTYYETRSSMEYQLVKNDPQRLQQMFNEGMTYDQISTQLNCCVDSLSKITKQHDLFIPMKYRSQGEQEIEAFIKDFVSNISVCNKKIISPYELDLYIPEYKLAIEYCGLYWHSEAQGKNQNYHLNKLNACVSKGIRLLTIFEDEYLKTPELVKNRIKQRVGKFDGIKINARDCVVKEISARLKQYFLDAYHLQGNDISKVYLGLYHKNELVAVMTFARPSRSRASNEMIRTQGLWELNRFATNYHYIVRGAAGKLLKYFQNNYDWDTIYSYADKRWSGGEMYHKLGFRYIGDTRPNYWYFLQGRKERIYRYRFTKQRLVAEGFDSKLTEKEIMKQRGYLRIWDCGMMKFQLHNPKV